MEEGGLSSAEFEPYLNDKKFTWFVDEFKKELSSFERAKEWADLIKCLQKLTRVCTHNYPTHTLGVVQISPVPCRTREVDILQTVGPVLQPFSPCWGPHQDTGNI